MEEETRINQVPTVPPAATFFPVATTKLMVLSICTFGVYDFYWFYKNWCLIAERTQATMNPVLRALFSPFWAYSCFREIRQAGTSLKIPDSFNEGWLAVTWVLLWISQNLPFPYNWLSAFTFIPLLLANGYATRINKFHDPKFDRNDKFSIWNWLWIIFGGALLVVSVVVSFQLVLEN